MSIRNQLILAVVWLICGDGRDRTSASLGAAA